MNTNATLPSLLRRASTGRRPARGIAKMLTIVGGLHGAIATAGAATIWDVTSGPLNEWVPDGRMEGIQHTLVVDAPFGGLGDVNVRLVLEPGLDGAFAGDLFVTLVHDGRMAVLLNRPGRSPSRPFGYSDDGALVLTFDDAAIMGDIHRYRSILSGNSGRPLTGDLTGTWQPDGRTTDPLAVLDSDARGAFLEGFAGSNPDGLWTLFVADLNGGGSVRLRDWALELGTDGDVGGPNVPEGGSTFGLLAMGCGLSWLGMSARKTGATRIPA